MTPAPERGLPDLEVRHTALTDPAARPLLEELQYEYAGRYGRVADGELTRYPNEQFSTAEGGAFLLLFEGEAAVAGGAFRRYDAATAELKRIWTHSAHRRRGLARRVVAALEDEARRIGYTRVYLTTGPRQPEAKGLYLATGYRPLFDVTADPETIGPLPFDKLLARTGQPTEE